MLFSDKTPKEQAVVLKQAVGKTCPACFMGKVYTYFERDCGYCGGSGIYKGRKPKDANTEKEPR